MYNIARAKAIAIGPREISGYVGYFLVRSELLQLFRLDGFNDKTVKSYAQRWMQCDLVSEPVTNVYCFYPETKSQIESLKKFNVGLGNLLLINKEALT